MIYRPVYATLLLSLSAYGQQAGTKPDIDPGALQADIATENLMSHLHALQDIADANGGNRAFGLPGYQASVDYIWSQISNTPGTKIWKQDFPGNFSWSEAELRIGGANTSVPVVAVVKSPTTPESGIEAELVTGPEGPAACNDTSYANLDVLGKIVLVERGICEGVIGGKIIAAAHAGAAAVILYQDTPAEVFSPELPETLPDHVPAGAISQADGQNLLAQLASSDAPLRAYFRQKQIREERTTQNVFAETEGGDPDSVIMLGAHLDSVQTGPGINDNGSGSSLILEIFRNVAKYRTKNKLRFAWWAAEESIGLGSRFYCYNLTDNFPSEADKIVAYLNFDMVSRGTYYVSDGDGSTGGGWPTQPGSDVIEKLWLDYFTGIGITAQERAIGFDSDHFFFQEILKKPVGFLFTGVDVAEDPCYHKACDVVDGVNPEMLTTNARAAAYMTAVLATNGTGLIPRSSLPVGGAGTRRSLADGEMGFAAQYGHASRV